MNGIGSSDLCCGDDGGNVEIIVEEYIPNEWNA